MSLPEIDIAWLSWVFETIQSEALLEELPKVYHGILNLTFEFGLYAILEFSGFKIRIKVKHEGVVVP